MIADEVLFVREPDEERVQEFLHATDLLHQIQNEDDHKKCPNQNPTPAPCTWCQRHYGDKYMVWRLLMVLNAPL